MTQNRYKRKKFDPIRSHGTTELCGQRMDAMCKAFGLVWGLDAAEEEIDERDYARSVKLINYAKVKCDKIEGELLRRANKGGSKDERDERRG